MNYLTCEWCGADTEYRITGLTQGLFCTQCDWCVVTTHIPEIRKDTSQYQIYLISADRDNKNHIRTLAKIANINFLRARTLIGQTQPLILESCAEKIDRIRKTLDEQKIRYKITPDFPY